MGKNKKGENAKKLPRYKEGTIEAFAQKDGIMSQCIQELSGILQHEGCVNTRFLGKQTVLNLDEVEKRKAAGNQDNTVDMVVGCHANTLLMTEAKLRVKSIENAIANILAKIRHSKDLLNTDYDYIVFPMTVLLLRRERFEQQKNKLLRLLNNKTDLLCPMTVEDFCSSEIFSKAY